MKRRPLWLVLACAGASSIALSAAAQSTAQPRMGAAQTEPTPYGLFLAGRAAMFEGDSRASAALLARAAQAAPNDATLRERAFTAALLTGDVATAARTAPTDAEAPLYQVGQIAKAVEALAVRRGRDADRVLRAFEPQEPHGSGVTLLRQHAAAAAGDWRRATAPVVADGDRVKELFAKAARARLLELRRDTAGADAAWRELTADSVAGPLFAPGYAEFLERRGRRAEALAIYDQALTERPRDEALRQAKARVQSGAPAPALSTLNESAAESLSAASAALLAERQTEMALIYLRFALRLDPTHERSWLLVGEAMEGLGDLDAALDAWNRVPAGSPNLVAAKVRVALALAERERHAEAEAAALAAVAARPDSPEAVLTLAEVHRGADKHAEAAAAIDALAARSGEDSLDWQMLFARGVALERSGQWPRAEADLEKALSLQPENPELLNYLGYAWVDRGTKVEEGMALVERAVAQRPRSGPIQDSLGWAKYRLGRFDEALPILELAVELEPGDPEINEHLGDVYWKVGRRREAEFQWRRVLTLNPDPARRATVEAKIRDGLPEAAAGGAR